MPAICKYLLVLLALLLTGGAALPLLSPHFLVRRLAAHHPDVLFFAETDRPRVALTIDDAPHPDLTPAILDVLKSHGARATFFVIGSRVAGNEAILDRMIAEGHEIANHQWTDRPGIRMDSAAFRGSVDRTRRALEPFGASRKWMRPGSGWFDDAMLAVLRKTGYRCVLGSVYPFDTAHGIAAFSAWYIRRHVHPGAIIILHDGGPERRDTVAVLESVLPELTRRGYRVVTLDELVNRPSGR